MPDNQKPILSENASNVSMGYNPETKVMGKINLESLTIDFETPKGKIRVRLQGDVFERFNVLYEQQVTSRTKK